MESRKMKTEKNRPNFIGPYHMPDVFTLQDEMYLFNFVAETAFCISQA